MFGQVHEYRDLPIAYIFGKMTNLLLFEGLGWHAGECPTGLSTAPVNQPPKSLVYCTVVEQHAITLEDYWLLPLFCP
jgi:hypothetical protein